MQHGLTTTTLNLCQTPFQCSTHGHWLIFIIITTVTVTFIAWICRTLHTPMAHILYRPSKIQQQKRQENERMPWPWPGDVKASSIKATQHTRLTALRPGLPRWASTRKVKPTWILLKQGTVSGSGISWAICKSAPHSRQITTPAPHHSVFLQAGCPSCCPTNSVKALKAQNSKKNSRSF